MADRKRAGSPVARDGAALVEAAKEIEVATRRQEEIRVLCVLTPGPDERVRRFAGGAATVSHPAGRIADGRWR